MQNIKCCSVFIFLFSFIFPAESSVNLAFNRPTRQSSTFVDYVSGKAVDGNADTDFFNGSCSHTGEDTKAWWQVDMENRSEIKSIKIYYRKDATHHLNGFKVYLTMMMDNWNNSLPCYTDTDEGNFAEIYVINCTGQGKHVTIFNDFIYPGDRNAVLELCEVQIYGCETGLYGNRTCNQTCSTNCRERRCDPDSGRCLFGCEDGWKGEKCNNQCGFDEFGPDCIFKCNCLVGDCSSISGICETQGCQPGWTGKRCDEICGKNHFGMDCDSICNCENSSCHHITGKCNTPGCQHGWKGDSCSTECAFGDFGPDCRFKCNCLTGGCNFVSGICEIQGCQAGWTGKRCDEMASSESNNLMSAVVGGGVIAFILAATVSVVLFIILWRRMKSKFKKTNLYEDTSAKNFTEKKESVYDDLEERGINNYVNTAMQSNKVEMTNV